LDIDQKLFENIPDESVANIIKRKAVFDSILNRDVPSIFDPISE